MALAASRDKALSVNRNVTGLLLAEENNHMYYIEMSYFSCYL